MLLLLAVGIVVFYVYKQKESSENVATGNTSVDEPEDVIMQYYESYLLNRASLSDLLQTPNDTLNPKFVTNKFIGDYKTREIGFSQPDHFLCAQDYPQNTDELSIKVLEKNDSNATLNIKLLNNWSSIPVYMVKEDDGWKIDKIDCANKF